MKRIMVQVIVDSRGYFSKEKVLLSLSFPFICLLAVSLSSRKENEQKWNGNGNKKEKIETSDVSGTKTTNFTRKRRVELLQ